MDVLEAEALSCREVLNWLTSKCLAKVIIKSDSQILVNAITNSIDYYSIVGVEINDTIMKFEIKK